MRESYERALGLVLQHEGGWSNNPADPGGATMKGVTQAVYDDYRHSIGAPARTVREIEDAELHAIYRSGYWDRIKGDDLPAGVDYATFDAAVNSGPGRGAKWLQHALLVTLDGAIGPQTIAAAKAADPVRTIDAMCDLRLEFLRGLGTWPTFGRGWQRRVDDVRRVAREMARAPASPVPPERPWSHEDGTLAIDTHVAGSGATKVTIPDPPVPWYVALIRAILSLFGRK